MAIGFLLAIVSGFIWSVVNVIDKTVVSKYIKNPIFMILIFSVVSFIIGIVAVPFIPGGLVGWAWFWVILAGVGYMLATLLYFYALQIEEASRVVPLFSLSTAFLVIISAIFLGEIFSFITYFGILLIIIGTIIITARKNIFEAFTSKALWLMALGAFGWAGSSAISKYLLDSYTYWQVYSWQRIFVGLIGIVFALFFFKNIRQVYSQIKKRYVALHSFSEVLNLLGVFVFTVAISYWFVSLANTVASVQYVFIFLWAVIISRFKPSLFTEEVNKRVIWQKVVSIALIIVGIYLIT